SELEFDKVLQLVAAHARTRLGRLLVSAYADLPSFDRAVASADFNAAVAEAVNRDGPLSFDGVDAAAPWLEPGAPSPSEPADFLDLLALARGTASVRRRLAALGDELAVLRAVADELPDTSTLVAEVSPLLGRDGRIPDDASPELARLRRASARHRQELLQVLEGVRREHREAVTDAPVTVRRDRYCLPVRSGGRSQVPGLLLDTSSSGATAFIEPFAAVELNNALAEAASRERHEIQRILRDIGAAFAAAAPDLAAGLEVLARLDAAQAAVLFGRRAGGRIVRPGDGESLRLLEARHPLLDDRLRELRIEVFGDGERRREARPAVPLDFALPDGVRTLVVSGPNAGGKTVVLKTIGLMVLMAYHGIPLPVAVGTTIPSFDGLWCHIGDEQDVTADLSTFSGAMAATARLLAEAGDRSLVLYDELGAGTDPLEGAALGCALLEELTGRGALTVATTHLASVAMAASAASGQDNAAMEYDEASEAPTYRLVVGRPGRSRALEIARRMGIPGPVLGRAEELLGGDHLELDRWLRRLEALEQDLIEERAAIAGREAALAGLRRDAEAELARLEAERARVPVELAEERDRLRRRAKQQLDRAVAALEEATRDLKPLGRRAVQKLRDEALDLEQRQPAGSSDATAPPEPGTRVRLAGLGGEGEVAEVRGSQVSVVVGSTRLWVPASEVEVLGGPARTPPRRPVCVEVADAAPRELMLLGMDSERARDEVEKALDQAFAAGQRVLRIVHGHGTGTLRRMVAEVCREHPAVRSFRHPPGSRGGTGATEVELEESG
ncbi:MAG TPA: Smr/MutS family protein, partial [Candidatus Sulfomarinibacteraceae bacterium]|nr:Smr/MutS family protein [Candidatus Sulfomarinibacteraceae bacterium]